MISGFFFFQINIKTKNTREFDQEMIELPLQEISQYSNTL